MDGLSQEIAWLSKTADTIIAFLIAYSFQILWAVVLLVVGFKIATWVAAQVARFGERRGFNSTIVRFSSAAIRLGILAFVGLAVLAKFNVSIAPLIALLGAGAFGATVAVQGTIANYGAGLVIVVTRPFKIGDTISVRGVHGVVQDIRLPTTTLIGDSGETITIPNRHIMGEILVNSQGHKIVTAEFKVPFDTPAERVLDVLRQAIHQVPGANTGHPPEIGLHDLSGGAMTVAIRYWVPSRDYFRTRCAVNEAALQALERAGIRPA